MKVKIVILFFVVLQVNASFFDRFQGAMSSVENAFGKLLNDVVSDVKSTVQCTILAMEHVLAVNGIVPEPETNNECYGYSSDMGTKNSNRHVHSSNDIATQISSSISRVNKTLSNILDNNDHERLRDIKRAFNNESNRLTEISNLLRRELERISHRMKTEFQSVDFNSGKTSIESLWHDMKLLYEVEKNDKNISEANEIGQIFNEALDLLHINKTNEHKSDEDKIKAIMLEMENESSNRNVDTIKTINRELSQWKSTIQPSSNKLTSEGPPKSFKDVATKIFKQNENIRNEVHNYITNKSINVVNNEVLNVKSRTNTNSGSVNAKEIATKTLRDNKKLMQINNFITNTSSVVINNKVVNKDSENTEGRSISRNTKTYDNSPFGDVNSKDAIDQAMDILKDGIQSQNLLDDLFASNVHGTDVFNSSNFF